MLPSLSLELLSVSESDPELLSESLEELLPLLLLPLLLPLLEGTEALQLACGRPALSAHEAPGRKGEESQVSKHTYTTERAVVPPACASVSVT